MHAYTCYVVNLKYIHIFLFLFIHLQGCSQKEVRHKIHLQSFCFLWSENHKQNFEWKVSCGLFQKGRGKHKQHAVVSIAFGIRLVLVTEASVNHASDQKL